MRFARLSRIREILGGTRDEIEYPSDAQKFVEDEEYLILDLVLNWVSAIEKLTVVVALARHWNCN